MHGGRIHLYSACIYKGERRMPYTGKKDAPTFSFCVIKCVDFWLCHVNMKEKVRKRPCIPQEASQTAHFDPPGSLALHGRGGSVRRRDHDQAAGTRAQLAGGASLEEALSLFPIVPSTRQVAAALSAAVTTTKQQETASNSQGGASLEEESSLFPAALREGARGRGFSQRSRLPRNTPTFSYGGRSRRLCQPP